MKKSHVNVVSNDKVTNEVVANECGLKWIGLNCLHTTSSICHMTKLIAY